jgi:hypothetical protein
MNGVIRRYHLAEFHPPFAPDLERQEMPNSEQLNDQCMINIANRSSGIILDFRDGRTLQCALQTPISQRQILKSMFCAHVIKATLANCA